MLYSNAWQNVIHRYYILYSSVRIYWGSVGWNIVISALSSCAPWGGGGWLTLSNCNVQALALGTDQRIVTDMNTNTQTFKKGELVTRLGSWDQTGTIFVEHYIVSSWGKKQATLVKVGDLSNAKFRVYTEAGRASRLQGIWSWRIIATADYSEEVGMEFARECIADEHRRATERLQRAMARGTYEEFETDLFAKHNATAWAPAVRVGYATPPPASQR